MRVEKRINEIVNRLNRTKVERKPDLKGKLHILHISFIMSNLQRLRELSAGKIITTYSISTHESFHFLGFLDV